MSAGGEPPGGLAHEPPRRRLLPRALVWVLLPLMVALAVVLLGVHLGASEPDAWYTELVRWLVG